MHHTGFVCGLQPAHDRPRDAQHAQNRQLAVAREDRREIVPLDVWHRDVLDAVNLAEVVDADDVLVRDLARQQQLALEAALQVTRGLWIGSDLRPHDLERDRDANSASQA